MYFKENTLQCHSIRKLSFWNLNGKIFKKITESYRGVGKSLSRPGRKQATATENFEFHISYL